ncbi:dienelactone hydrolase family protein [Pontibacter chitinilyticus]|uniref:dienelactone hydrolase family protein n=1 Tax=Pontibacter chitinilyticus TaxID=2674989 RepID=UPI00321B89FA
MEINQANVILEVQDGTEMQAYVASPLPGTGTYPGLIVFQEAFGVNQHIRSVCDRFAAEGYVVIAPELFHRSGAPGVTIDYNNFAAALPHMQALTTAGLEADANAAWKWLQQQPGIRKDLIVCTGYCMGGRTSFLANTILPFKAAVSYYGGRIPDLLGRAAAIQAPMLFFWGGLDKHIQQEQIQQVKDALTAAGKQYVNVEISDADHGFFCNERASYNAEAAAEAWELTLSFLRTKLSIT